MQSPDNNFTGGTSGLERNQYLWLLFVTFLIGCWVRLFRIGDQVVIDDEWHALNSVQNRDFTWIFTHFGGADHSIPLALLYELQYHLLGLNEWLMRWPMLLAGCLAIVLIPYLLRQWLDRSERLLLAALIAISPLLIYYSRFARPYSILAILEPLALLMAWQWWTTKRSSFGLGWVLSASLAAWLNLSALIVVTAPFAWFGLLAIRQAMRFRNWRPLLRLTGIGIVTLIPLGLLLGPPIARHAGALISKTGLHYVNLETIPWALSLASGSGRFWVFMPMALLALFGYWQLLKRDRPFGIFLGVTCALAVLVLTVTGAKYAMHGNVFLRYIIGLVPFYLAFAAIGLVDLTSRAGGAMTRTPAGIGFSVLVVCAALVASGPVPDWPLRSNQFLTHQKYHFHYDWNRNLYKLSMDRWFREEDFYREIANRHPDGDAVVVEAPWHLESFSNPINLQQDIHGQSVLIGFVNGTCADPLPGELKAGQPGMKFRNFVYLSDLLDGSREADYLVLRRRGLKQSARKIEMDFATCEKLLRERFGSPMWETNDALVFLLSENNGRGNAD